jgi:hypothetical protein
VAPLVAVVSVDRAEDRDGNGFPDELDEALNDGKPKIISVWGRAGSGKSVFNRRLYHSWAGDKLAIDVNGNAEPGEDAERISRDEISSRWPQQPLELGERRRPRNLWFRADPGSATYVDDLDRAVGMTLFPQDRPTMLWAGECGEMMPNGKTGPHMRRLLQQNRHHRVTALLDGPRPVYVNPLVLSQSAFVAIYHLPNPNDRKRVAESIGYPARRLEVEHEETQRRNAAAKKKGEPHFWFLFWHRDGHQMYRMAPLPVEELTEAQREGAA